MKAKGPSLSNFGALILFVDNHLLVVNKPAGMPVQGDISGDLSLLDAGKAWLKTEYGKPGNVFLGLVHRLDRPVSGVVAFARTSKAASRLSEQFRERTVGKVYRAWVEGVTPAQGHLKDQIVRLESGSEIGRGGEGQMAELSYKRIKTAGGASLLEIELGTGRHHQIRVQFANAGHPIVGDRRYGSRTDYAEGKIALQAHSLSIKHPIRDERLTFTAPPDSDWPRP